MKTVPCPVALLIALVQLFLALASMGLEIWNVLINVYFGTIYAGLWCGSVFLVVAISMLCLTCCCCCKPTCCEIFSVICNIAACVFAVALIVISSILLVNPNICVLQPYYCGGNATAWLNAEISQFSFNYLDPHISASVLNEPLSDKALPLKLLIATGAAMSTTNILYITIVSFRNRCCKK